MHSAGTGRHLALETLRGTLLTRRLIMRMPAAADLVAVARLINDPVIAQNTAVIRYPYPVTSGRRWIEAVTRQADAQTHLPFMLTLRSNPRLIAGSAGIHLGRRGIPTIGYWIAKPYRRRGFASEAARALIDLAFTRSDVSAIAARARVSNIGSQRVLLGAGMRRIGTARIKCAQLARYVPALHFAIERKAWENAQGPRTSARGVHEAL